MSKIETGSDLVERGKDRVAGTLRAAPDEDHPDLVAARTPLSLRASTRGAGDWRHPVPPALLEVVDKPARDRYEKLVSRLDAVEGRIAELNAALAEAQARDDKRERSAVLAGRPMPKPTAAKLEAELEEARREREIILDELPALASAMVASLRNETVQQVADAATTRCDELLGEAQTMARRAAELIAHASREKGVAVWIGVLLDRRWQAPGAGGTARLRGTEPLDATARKLDGEIARARDRFAGAAAD